jgi:hypothetical protein
MDRGRLGDPNSSYWVSKVVKCDVDAAGSMMDFEVSGAEAQPPSERGL